MTEHIHAYHDEEGVPIHPSQEGRGYVYTTAWVARSTRVYQVRVPMPMVLRIQ